MTGVQTCALPICGKLDKAATRGDGSVGEDITHNIKTLPSVPLELLKGSNNKGIPNSLEVRGEVFIESSKFESINKTSDRKSVV